MSNGLGAGFFGLALLAALLGLAGLLVLTMIGVAGFRQRSGIVSGLLEYVSILLLFGVVGVAGFGVLAMYDEASLFALLFLTAVFVPLAATGGYLARTTTVGLRDGVATTGLAWSFPFLIGVSVTVGLILTASSLLDLPPASSQQRGVVSTATVVGGAVATVGSIYVGRRLSQPVSETGP